MRGQAGGKAKKRHSKKKCVSVSIPRTARFEPITTGSHSSGNNLAEDEHKEDVPHEDTVVDRLEKRVVVDVKGQQVLCKWESNGKNGLENDHRDKTEGWEP